MDSSQIMEMMRFSFVDQDDAVAVLRVILVNGNMRTRKLVFGD